MLLEEQTTDLTKVFAEQHWDVHRLLSVLKMYIDNDLQHPDSALFRVPKLLELRECCSNWNVEETIVTT